PLDDTVRERPLEELGEDRQDMKDHGRLMSFNPSGNSTTMRRAAGLISTQMERENGISSAWSPLPTTRRPEPPPSSQPVTGPSDSPVRRSITSQPMRSS